MEPGSGRIITFYSYKGGTGRSMALANVAWVLAANRKRVLLIDWDLEAPGLHRYFRPFLIDKYLTSSDGLIDFVLAYADEVIKPAAESLPTDWFLPLADITAYAISVDFDGFPAPGRIDLVPAGCQGASYATRVNSFDWHNFYDRLGGGAFFEAVRDHMRQEYDYILIDSRTGVSDTSGICTIQMPDALAVCFTYNNQSIEGAAAIAKSAREGRSKLPGVDGRSGFDVFPIPTRVEQAEQQKLRTRQKYARSHFNDLLPSDLDSDAYWKAVEIPYVPFYGYEETLAPFSEDPNDPKSLLGAIVRITRYVTAKDRAPDEKVDFNLSLSEEENRRIRQEFAATPDSQTADETPSSLTSVEDVIREKVRQADTVFLHLDPEAQAKARRILLRLVRVARREDGDEHSRQRIKLSEFDDLAPAVSDLGSSGLLTVAPDTLTGEATVELVDDSLLRNWLRLRSWIEEDRDFLIWRQKFRDQLRDWESSDFKSGFLLRSEQLREALNWRAQKGTSLNQAERKFISRSSETETTVSPKPVGVGRRAFIIRPFGKKQDLKGNEIDFDAVARLLIGPALERVGAEGRTTIDIVEAGNIRTDMFRRLLTADLVVADLSIHNANVFYELGVRHALRERSTFMLRCDTDAFPFDLQTDRYFVYRNANPAGSLEDLVMALQRAIDSDQKDSPVFMSLPDLRAPDIANLVTIPTDFSEEVSRAYTDKQTGDLALLSNEVRGFEWEVKGWRTIGEAQRNLKSFAGARATLESICKLEPSDLKANLWLGTIYERQGDLVRSTLALTRALDNKSIGKDQRAEAYSLLARNAKTRWNQAWSDAPPDGRRAQALRSAYLQEAIDGYSRAFDVDLNHYYSGLNALALLLMRNELAKAQPDVWSELFETDDEAERNLVVSQEQASKLASSVEQSVQANLRRLQREGSKDIWADLSAADLSFLTSKRPKRVAAAYRDALSSAPDFAHDSVRRQLAIYSDLGVLDANLPDVVDVVGEPIHDYKLAPTQQRGRVLLFAGHMIDAPNREKPRFPADKESIAREKIKEAVVQEMEASAGVACAYAGGASGGDLLFQEVCAELGISTRLYLAIPPQKYLLSSVAKAGPGWVDRFWKIYNAHSAQGQVRVLSDAIDVKTDADYLPAWLRSKPDYTIWQRYNLWILFNALDAGPDSRSGNPNITLISLWDGGGDGAGGIADLVQKVTGLGARSHVIDTKALFGL